MGGALRAGLVGGVKLENPVFEVRVWRTEVSV